MRRFRRLILALIVVVCVAIGAIYYRIHSDTQKAADQTPPPKRSDKKLHQENFDYIKHEGTREIVHVIAKEFTQIGDTDKYDLIDVDLRLFHKDGQTFDQVKSKKAQFDQTSGILFSDGDVEITMGIPDEEKIKATGKLLTIRSSGVEYDSKNGKAKTDREASFSFDRGDGKSIGAVYDPTTRELTMVKDVVLHWKAQTPKQKDMEVQAGNLVYKELDSKVFLSPWSKLKRDTLNVEAGNSIVTLKEGALQLIESQKAHGINKDPDRTLDFASDSMRMEFDDDGVVKGISGEQNAKVISLTADAQTTVTSNRVDMSFDTAMADSRLQTAIANGNGYVESKPVAKPNVPMPDTRILRSEKIVLQMNADGKDIKQVETLTPGSVEFIPNRPDQKHRTLNGDHIWVDYGPQNRIQQFRAVAVSTRTDNPTPKGKPPAPPSLTWSKDLKADFDPKNGQMTKLEQSNDFRYEEGDRKARSDKASFDYTKNVITLDGPASRVWDPTGSTIGDRIVMNQQTGDMEATGNVSSVRERDKARKKAGGEGLLSGDEPVQAKAAKMTATHENSIIRYTGNALLWQGSNRLQADTVDIDRDKGMIAAHGNVISQFVDKSDPSKTSGASSKPATASNKPVFTIVRAPDMVYRDGEKMAHYTGGAVLNRPGMTVQSLELRAFLKTAEGSDSNLDRAVADGGVKIVQTTAGRRRIGTSEHAEYYASEGKVILEGGQPQMVDSAKGMTQGTKLTYFQANDRLLVNGVDTQPAVSNIRSK